jgi:hypothetical protein
MTNRLDATYKKVAAYFDNIRLANEFSVNYSPLVWIKSSRLNLIMHYMERGYEKLSCTESVIVNLLGFVVSHNSIVPNFNDDANIACSSRIYSILRTQPSALLKQMLFFQT